MPSLVDASSNTPQSHPGDLHLPDLASRVATLLLAAAAEPRDADAMQSGSRTGALAPALTNGFLSTLTPLLAALPDTATDTAAILRALMERTARLEADLFVLKATLAAERRFVMAEAAGYTDPVSVIAAYDQPAAGPHPSLDRLDVPLGPSVLGHGWHGVERLPEGGWWRWSGPDRRATLLLPSLGATTHQISWQFRVLARSQLDGLEVKVNGVAVTPQIDWESDEFGRITLTSVLPAPHAPRYLYVDALIGATRRPSDLGPSDDTRALGMGVGVVKLS